MSLITVTTYEAKVQLSKLLAACERGDTVTITRGQTVPVATGDGSRWQPNTGDSFQVFGWQLWWARAWFLWTRGGGRLFGTRGRFSCFIRLARWWACWW